MVVSMAGFRCFCVLILALLLGSAATAAAQPPTQPTGRQSAALPRAREAPPGQPAAPTAPDMKIAAIVNDEVISVFDLVSRIRMVLISSSIPDTPENRQRIAGQVLRSLKQAGQISVLLVEQYFEFALKLADRYYVMEKGSIVLHGSSADLDKEAIKPYLAF